MSFTFFYFCHFKCFSFCVCVCVEECLLIPYSFCPNSFSIISWNADLLAMILFLKFYLLKNVFPLFLKDIFAEYVILLRLPFTPFSLLEILLHCHLTHIISKKRSVVIHICVPLYLCVCLFSLPVRLPLWVSEVQIWYF